MNGLLLVGWLMTNFCVFVYSFSFSVVKIKSLEWLRAVELNWMGNWNWQKKKNERKTLIKVFIDGLTHLTVRFRLYDYWTYCVMIFSVSKNKLKVMVYGWYLRWVTLTLRFFSSNKIWSWDVGFFYFHFKKKTFNGVCFHPSIQLSIYLSKHPDG